MNVNQISCPKEPDMIHQDTITKTITTTVEIDEIKDIVLVALVDTEAKDVSEQLFQWSTILELEIKDKESLMMLENQSNATTRDMGTVPSKIKSKTKATQQQEIWVP